MTFILKSTNMKRNYVLMSVFLSMLGMHNARGQSIGPSTLNSTGGSGTIGTTIFDWSIGEMTMVSTFTGSSVIVTQGVLQNNKVPDGVGHLDITNQLQVFPNPASSIVNVRYTAAGPGKLTLRLMDITGKLITTSNTQVDQGVTSEQLSIADLAAATYMLEVSFKGNSGTQGLTSYKIEKLK